MSEVNGHIDDVLRQVAERDASDLHITVGVPPIVRIHGDLQSLDYPALKPDDTRHLIFGMLTNEQRQKVENGLECDLSYSLHGKARFRVNVFQQRNSIGASFRLVPAVIKSLDELQLPPVLETLTRKPRGFVCVTGPTGSGKSTTLASLINIINETRSVHVVTVEDPIEYLHSHKNSVINQREVGSDTRSFATALKFVLRQDPDVILIGEMRDVETIAAGLTAAETGHLVFTTLHTQDSAQTIDRIIDVFPPHQQQQIRVQLAGTLQGVISQQLLPSKDSQGRVVGTEIMMPTPGIRNMIRESKTHLIYNAVQTGQKFGMVTMDQALVDLYRRGKITYETAVSRSVDPRDLKDMLGRTA